MNNTYKWAVVGAGPAGIAVIQKLLMNEVNPKHILWIDPYFSVGDLGRLWPNVSGNTSVELFRSFLKELNFRNLKRHHLNDLSGNDTCDLKYIVEPLNEITQELINRVDTRKSYVKSLNKQKGHWTIDTNSKETFESERIILATGAIPKELPCSLPIIPLEKALDKSRLCYEVSEKDTVLVFGASHSAIIALKHLVDLKIKKIINFYTQPCRYAHKIDDHILYDNTGLKGLSAQWAQQFIERQLPTSLERHPYVPITVEHYCKTATKAIFAIGFQTRDEIHSPLYDLKNYDPFTGIIASGLFGFGIAYPERITSPFGQQELQVGLWKFIQYLNRVLPIWVQYPA